MLPKAVVTNGHTEHSTTAANEPNVPPEKWQQKRLVRQKEKLRSNLLKSGFQFLDRFVELLKEMEDVPKDTKKKYLQKMLHAIFFFGQIHVTPIEPREFLPESHQDTFRCLYLAPFQQCTTHLPTKTPYSILLDYPICAPRQHFPSRPDDYIMSLNDSYEGLCHRLLESSHRYSDQLLFNYSVPDTGATFWLSRGASSSCCSGRFLLLKNDVVPWGVEHGPNTGCRVLVTNDVCSR
ncbi:uncharacterized protein LOC142069008 isoform X2 [Caretta caretta]|uniref:uncharacterized protein LOC142069008 isoform X2 n=1 Tax=Caretta caretta TaxID=8467 RepID=UPI003F4C243B